MATVEKHFADNIARHEGYLDGNTDNELGDNPRCVLIVEYTNAWDGQCYGVVFENESPSQQLRYFVPTEFVRNPRVYWRYQRPPSESKP